MKRAALEDMQSRSQQALDDAREARWRVFEGTLSANDLRALLAGLPDFEDVVALVRARREMTLLLEIERTARQHRCDAIHLSLPEIPEGPLRGRIERIGLHMEGVRLCKSLAPAAAAE